MHVSILVPQGQVVVSSVVGTFKIFNSINQYLISTGKSQSPFYTIDMVGTKESGSYYNGLFEIKTTANIDDISTTDLIIVTTVAGNPVEGIELNKAFIPWIQHQRIHNDAEVASLCMGAFLLAETGLLNGKAAATHWMGHDAFRAMYPEVELLPAKIITEDNGIYTSGGAYSFLNLLLHLVEKYNGREAAIYCSKLFEIEFDRENQNQFIVFQGQKDHEDEAIIQAQEYIEQNVSNKVSIDALAEKASTSRRNFVRRFKKATSNSPLEYMQRVKVEYAKKQLESSTLNVSEVMYSVGYSDDKAFRNLFKKLTGLSPIDYRKKYNREMVML